jgi:hypothetical protein
MKQYLICLVIILTLCGTAYAQAYSPYTLGAVSDLELDESVTLVKQNLQDNGFKVLGEYAPGGDSARWLIVITSRELIDAVGRTGNLSTVAAVLRVGLTMETGGVNISYTTPEYWWNAYFRDNYNEVSSMLSPITGRLKLAMRKSGNYKGKGFGSEEGLKAEDLRNYRYMVGMQKFHNTVKLKEFASYREAIDKIESSLIKGIPGVRKVYSVEIPEHDLKLYGFALGGEKGESHFLPIIDITEPRHTAFLPYELLVKGSEVHMLHGRYRIALSFPDLKMGTFTKIMSTPGDIKDLLKSIVE